MSSVEKDLEEKVESVEEKVEESIEEKVEESVEQTKESLYLPEQGEFKYLLIKNKDISGIRYDDPEYKRIICSLDIYEERSVNSETFFDNMVDDMKLNEFVNYGLNTQSIWATKDYIYELIHIDLMPGNNPVEIYNGVANMLKTDMQHIFGNAIMIKTKAPVDDYKVEMVNCTRDDLHDLLENRVRHVGVRIDDDGETEEFTWYHEPDKFMDDFFVNDRKFEERSFMLHNLQIYYTPGTRDDFEKLLGKKYDQMVIMTKVTEHFYGNIHLDEIKSILRLLKTECPEECPEEWKKPSVELEETLRSERRKFIFNKYKALYQAEKEYL